MQRRRIILGILPALFVFAAYADAVKIGAVVLDDMTSMPVSDVEVCFSFKEDVGWRVWTESSKHHTMCGRTDSKGCCLMTGTSNCGQAGCYVRNPPDGYYRPALGWKNKFAAKDLFGVWQPDNLVATIRLQRVEHPIPLFVKRVELRDYAKGIGGFDGTNSVLRFDLMKGDWLPPYGIGEIADFTVVSKVKITGTGKLRKPYPDFGWSTMRFYLLQSKVSFSESDGISERVAKPADGLKIRCVRDEPAGNGIVRVSGVRQIFGRTGKDWHSEGFSDEDPDRCYTFRIRSRRNGQGELVEAYYGKVYGDFAFEGDDKRGLVGVKFLYYLNPTSLDRNLEWDMKRNLCPNCGDIQRHYP